LRNRTARTHQHRLALRNYTVEPDGIYSLRDVGSCAAGCYSHRIDSENSIGTTGNSGGSPNAVNKNNSSAALSVSLRLCGKELFTAEAQRYADRREDPVLTISVAGDVRMVFSDRFA